MPSLSSTPRGNSSLLSGTVQWGLLVAAALAPIGLLGATAYMLTGHSVRRLFQQNNESAARITVELVARDLENSARLAEAFASLPEMVAAVERRDEVAARERLRVMVKTYPRLDRAFVVDAQGTLWTDFPRASESLGENFASRDYFRGVSASGQTYVSEVYQRNAPPKPLVVSIATPICQDQETLGILVCQYRLDGLTTWLKGINVGQSGYVFLLDHTGTVAAHPKLDLQIREYNDYANLSFVQEVASETVNRGSRPRTEEYFDPLSQKPMVATSVPVPVGTRRWVIVAQQPRHEAYAPIRRLGTQIGIAAAILALAATGVVVVLGRISQGNRRLNRELEERNFRLKSRRRNWTPPELPQRRPPGQKATSLPT